VAARTAEFWSHPGNAGKILAVCCVLFGLLVLSLLAYILIHLLPLLILGAIIMAVVGAVGKASN
jgi:hypothetical protein